MIEYIRNNSATAAIFSIVFLALLWYPDFAGFRHTHLPFLLPCTGMHYAGSMFDSTGYRLITIVMAIINGLAILILSIRYLSLGRANTILPFCYLLVIFSYPQARTFSASFPAALLVIFGLFALFRSGETKKPFSSIFISSFLVGCAGLLYLPSLVVAVSFIAISITLNTFSGRNMLVFLGGLLLPLGGCLFCRYLFFGDLPDYIGVIYESVRRMQIQIVPPPPATVFMTLVFFYLSLRALAKWLRRAYGNQSYRHRILTSFVWMFVICGIPASLSVHEAYNYLPILSVPVSVLLTYYYSEERITKRMKVEFIVLMLSVALNQVAYFI